MRAVIYARTSTSGQEERHTIESQLIDCRDFCEAHGYQIVDEFTDEAVSGSVPFEDRPAGRRLLEVAQEELFDRVVILCVDRLGRDNYETLGAMRVFDRLHLPVDFTIQSFDGTPEGRFQFQIFTAVAEYEKGSIVRRTTGGRRRHVKEGQYMASHPPYGYTYDESGRQLVPHPEQAETVRQMFRWTLEGLGAKAIATRLEKEGIPPPRPKSRWGWYTSSVYQILTAPRYIGRGTYAGEPMSCPPLIDEKTFTTARLLLSRRKEVKHYTVKHVYLLQGLIRCRTCGGPVMSLARGRNCYYACRRRKTFGEAKAGHVGVTWSWRADRLEAVVKRHVLRLFSDPGYLLSAAEVYTERAQQATSDRAMNEAGLVTRLEQLDQERQRVIRALRKGLVSDAEAERELKDIEHTRDDVQAKLGALQQQPVDQVKFAQLAEVLKRQAAVVDYLRRFKPDYDEEVEGGIDEVMSEHLLGSREADETWLGLIRQFITQMWIEPDGAVSIEGVLTGQDDECTDGHHCSGAVTGVQLDSRQHENGGLDHGAPFVLPSISAG